MENTFKAHTISSPPPCKAVLVFQELHITFQNKPNFFWRLWQYVFFGFRWKDI